MALAGQINKDPIDFLTRQIRAIEAFIEKKLELRGAYKNLVTIPGVGKILGLTIMLETGPVQRFEKVGNYASYCRAVSSQWTSNGKAKGKGNKKIGNQYLCWAFSEAAEFARRSDDKARAFFNRKLRKSNFMVAHSALAHKLARAAYCCHEGSGPLYAGKDFYIRTGWSGEPASGLAKPQSLIGTRLTRRDAIDTDIEK